MALLTALAVGAGIMGAGSSILNTAFSHWQYKDQKRYNNEMSNTAYQRAVTDMEAAGLNPALMYGGGGTAESTPAVNTNGGTPLNNPAQSIQAVSSIMSSAAQVMNANKNPSSKSYQSAEQIISSIAKFIK